MSMSYVDASTLGEEILGAVKRRRAKKTVKSALKKGGKAARLVKLKLMALAARKRKPTKKPAAKKPVMRTVFARLSVAKRKALLAQAIKKNPKLKKAVVLAALKKRINERKEGAFMAPSDVERTPVPALSPGAPPAPAPARADVPEEEAMDTNQAVEQEMQEAPLAEAATEEADKEEATEEAADDAKEQAAEEAEADAEDMTEPSPEEAKDEAEEVAEDAQEAASEASGDLLAGIVLHRRKRQRRADAHANRCAWACRPMCRQIAEASGGAIEEAHLLGAVKLIAKAKKGDKKAKKGIKAVVKAAAKTKKKTSPVKKAAAKLKIAHTVMKKAGVAKGVTPKKKKVLAKKVKGKPARKAPFTQPVMVRSKGLSSYSAYQRGMATIPGYARSYYGS